MRPPAIILLCALMAARPLAAQARRAGPEIADLMRARSVVEMALSRDGRRAAYVTVFADSARDVLTRQIATVELARPGEVAQSLPIARGDRITQPRWSVDGRRLWFLAPDGGVLQLWASDGGGAPTRVGSSPNGVTSFALSDDGTLVATIEPEPATPPAAVYGVPEPVRRRHVFVVDARTGERRQLTSQPQVFDDIAWSPNGAELVVAHRPDLSTAAFVQGMDLSIIAAASGAMRPLVVRPGMDGSPVWSPDGRRIAFITHQGSTHWIGSTYVAVVDAHGGVPRLLGDTVTAERVLGGETRLAWRADGSAVLTMRPRGQGSVLVELPLGRGSARREEVLIDGVANDIATATDGRIAFLGATSTSAWELYVREASAAARRITYSNPHLDSLDVTPYEEVSWTAPDGRTIEGLLLLPARRSGRVPLVAYLHGGPAWSFVKALAPHGWAPKSMQGEAYPIHALAARGIAVLMPNPRGSLGRGPAFRLANVGDLGGADAADVLAGIDHLVRRGIVDSTRVGVMGFSYGGTLAAALLPQRRFRVAQVGAGMVDPVAAFGEMDIPQLVSAYTGGAPWESPDLYRRTTLWSKAPRIRTPTLIMSGDSDRRVPVSQSRALHRALTELGIASELILYRGEGHGVTRPSNQRDFMQRVLDWFDRGMQP